MGWGQPPGLCHGATAEWKHTFHHLLQMRGKDSLQPLLLPSFFFAFIEQGSVMEERNTLPVYAEFIQAGPPRNNSFSKPHPWAVTAFTQHAFSEHQNKTHPKKTPLQRNPGSTVNFPAQPWAKVPQDGSKIHVLKKQTSCAAPWEPWPWLQEALAIAGLPGGHLQKLRKHLRVHRLRDVATEAKTSQDFTLTRLWRPPHLTVGQNVSVFTS